MAEFRLVESVLTYGIFAIMFVWLFIDQRRDSRAREEKYQETIKTKDEELKKQAETLVEFLHLIKDIRIETREIMSEIRRSK